MSFKWIFSWVLVLFWTTFFFYKGILSIVVNVICLLKLIKLFIRNSCCIWLSSLYRLLGHLCSRAYSHTTAKAGLGIVDIFLGWKPFVDGPMKFSCISIDLQQLFKSQLLQIWSNVLALLTFWFRWARQVRNRKDEKKK